MQRSAEGLLLVHCLSLSLVCLPGSCRKGVMARTSETECLELDFVGNVVPVPMESRLKQSIGGFGTCSWCERYWGRGAWLDRESVCITLREFMASSTLRFWCPVGAMPKVSRLGECDSRPEAMGPPRAGHRDICLLPSACSYHAMRVDAVSLITLVLCLISYLEREDYQDKRKMASSTIDNRDRGSQSGAQVGCPLPWTRDRRTSRLSSIAVLYPS
jgi:hypothetical protein